MSELSVFSPEDTELLISLPYRVGVSISYTEDEEGEMDDVYEMEALEACIRQIAKLHEKSPLVSEIAGEILRRKDMWPKWSNQNIFNIAPDCEQAARVLKPIVSSQELKSYKKMLLEVATAVAQASGEFGDVHEKKGFFGRIMEKVVGSFANDDKNHPMNVSAAEDSAIEAIRQALAKVE
ncbi:MAG: hypothetical protein KDI61_07620 [Alphaproteobacteria bacterium]|nr:hypothetical protein [Alphaproteobacteria bacterium]MCB1840113.1 hypothetical protein [Alphaproteobacteria bacterium]